MAALLTSPYFQLLITVTVFTFVALLNARTYYPGQTREKNADSSPRLEKSKRGLNSAKSSDGSWPSFPSHDDSLANSEQGYMSPQNGQMKPPKDTIRTFSIRLEIKGPEPPTETYHSRIFPQSGDNSRPDRKQDTKRDSDTARETHLDQLAEEKVCDDPTQNSVRNFGDQRNERCLDKSTKQQKKLEQEREENDSRLLREKAKARRRKQTLCKGPGCENSFSAKHRTGHEGWIGQNITCDVCKVLVRSLQKLLKEQSTKEEIMQFAINFCKRHQIESDRVCDLVVHELADVVFGVLRGTVLNPKEICGYALGDGCADPVDPSELWNITISDVPKPPVKPHVLPKPGSPTLRVLQITDIHLDLDYRAGADAECGEPLCCRDNDLDPAPTKARRAGQYGDYRNCDIPPDTLELLFKHLASVSDQFDYVMFTGDIAPHNVWNQTRSDQLNYLHRLTKLFRTYLPRTPVYPCLGNHEGVPCNNFPPDAVEGPSLSWLYSAYLEAWGYWLPDTVAETILRGGFYAFSPYPGFRIISLNSNYGSNENWWLLVNATDPQGQLQWLADVLQQAENNGEKVHIMSHYPPGQTLKGFGWNYYRLMNRYENIITGQFHGHTHFDEYEVFYDLRNMSRAVATSYVAGSIATWAYTNPAYRIYTIDGAYRQSSWEVLDFSHYYLDIQTANKGGGVNWQKEYSARDVYGMPSLFPEDWSNLIYRMKTNDTLFQTYYRFYFKSAAFSQCDEICKRSVLCDLKTAWPYIRRDLCKDILDTKQQSMTSTRKRLYN